MVTANIVPSAAAPQAGAAPDDQADGGGQATFELLSRYPRQCCVALRTAHDPAPGCGYLVIDFAS